MAVRDIRCVHSARQKREGGNRAGRVASKEAGYSILVERGKAVDSILADERRGCTAKGRKEQEPEGRHESHHGRHTCLMVSWLVPEELGVCGWLLRM